MSAKSPKEAKIKENRKVAGFANSSSLPSEDLGTSDFVENVRLFTTLLIKKNHNEKDDKTLKEYYDLLYSSIMNHLTEATTNFLKARYLDIDKYISRLIPEIEAHLPHLNSEERDAMIAKSFMDAAASLVKMRYNKAGADEGLSAINMIPKYEPRQSGKASDFLKKNWGKLIGAGAAYRPDIRKYDPKLEMALRNEFRGRANDLRAILPNKADELDARIIRDLGQPVRPESRKAASTVLSALRQIKTP